jgi:hypothetical protein
MAAMASTEDALQQRPSSSFIPKKRRTKSEKQVDLSGPITPEYESTLERKTWENHKPQLKQGRTSDQYEAKWEAYNKWASELRQRTGQQVAGDDRHAKVTVRGAYEFLKSQENRTAAILENMIKGLNWKLAHYTVIPDEEKNNLRDFPQVMDIKVKAAFRQNEEAYKTNADRQPGIDRGYTPEEIEKVAHALFEACRKSNMTKGQSIINQFRARMEWTWLQGSMGRSQDVRDRELADLFCYEHHGVEPDSATVVACITTNSKQNRVSYAKLLRAKVHVLWASLSCPCFLCCIPSLCAAQAQRVHWYSAPHRCNAVLAFGNGSIHACSIRVAERETPLFPR